MVPTTSQERWPSGLRRTLGKRVGVNASPGFESPSLRHNFANPPPFILTKTLSKCHVMHNRQADDFWRTLEIFEGVLWCHPEKLGATKGTASFSGNATKMT